MHILYVEDHEANRRLLERVAQMGAHQMTTLVDGQTALDFLAAGQPDLLLVDVQLRGAVDGLSIVRQVRAGGSRLPIIALTAHAMPGDRDRCMAAGCDAYLPKPIPIPELLELIALFSQRIQKDES
jgi:CheY-like chemotaxis protein